MKILYPHERKRHALTTEHNSLLDERRAQRSKFAKARGTRLDAVEAQLDKLEDPAKIDQVITPAERAVKCYSRLCTNLVDPTVDDHSVVSQGAIIDHYPAATGDGPRVVWHYPPQIGDALYCKACADYLKSRQDEQNV